MNAPAQAMPRPLVRLWLDDLRPAPEGWVWAKSVNEAIEVTQISTVTHMSLDHDLGEFAYDGGDGTRFTDWMAEHDTWPTTGIRVHSWNSVGGAVMLTTIDRYSHFLPGWSNDRGVSPSGEWPAALMPA